MDIKKYTSYPEIRLLLGVSSMELDNDTLELPIVGHWLTVAFNDVYPGLISAYDEWVDDPTPTDDEIAAMAAVRVFATYAVAHEMQGTAGRSMLKSITDGRAKEERFGPGKDDLSWFLDRYNLARQALIDALVALGLIDAPRPLGPRIFFGTADLGFDPVLGDQ